MTPKERVKQQKELVETIGRFYDKEGLQPVAGRILSLLFVMDKEQFTFDEIVEELIISKGSASNGLRILELQDVIEYITRPGDRKRYFQIKKLDKFSLIDEQMSKIKKMSDFMKMIYDLKTDKKSGNSLFILNLIDILNFFLEKSDEFKKEYMSRT
jgi:hypothetical protein